MRLAAAAFLATLPCAGQKLFVYSELTRVDPFGNLVPQDRGTAQPRHILSPGIPRNATSSLRVVVWLEKPGEFNLDIAQNPDNAVKAMLYKEVYEKHGDTWIPDKLLPVTIPYNGKAADFSIPGQTHISFWLDMTVARTAPVDRVKVEPQLWTPAFDDWVTYPMEVRIMEPAIPDGKFPSSAVPPITASADAALAGPLGKVLCGGKETASPYAMTARHHVRRNAAQHLSLVKSAAELRTFLTGAPGVPTEESICSGQWKSASGPEWFLRVRDALFRAKSTVMP
jgi:hypothetical protein